MVGAVCQPGQVLHHERELLSTILTRAGWLDSHAQPEAIVVFVASNAGDRIVVCDLSYFVSENEDVPIGPSDLICVMRRDRQHQEWQSLLQHLANGSRP